ncbi:MULTISPECIES: Trp family transcriptional regulator [Neptunomonas]|uniref:Transcriptional regulator n=1 Tax=Neptunomonas marina TaxID=1815562 RepID=A0A437Q9X4_9GAMM|nr:MULTISPECIES: Trp family transcriptional regulator [Neptunomonas]RVU31371.1 transcriptional regulator [Neptunomonas marina]
MSTEKEYISDLVTHLLQQQDPDAMESALRALLTPTEFTEVTKRLQIFRMLEQGVPQRQIAETLGVGIATVTRGSRALQGK